MNTLRDYIDDRSRSNDISAEEWNKLGSNNEQYAYRLGMVYAYLDMRRQLGPKEEI